MGVITGLILSGLLNKGETMPIKETVAEQKCILIIDHEIEGLKSIYGCEDGNLYGDISAREVLEMLEKIKSMIKTPAESMGGSH